MNGTYHFFNYSPGTRKLRNLKVIAGTRSQEEWRGALKGHVDDAHKGVEQANCAGCRELREKAGAA